VNRRNYGPLREGQRPTLDDLNKHIEGNEPGREAGVPPRGDPMLRDYYEPLRQTERRTLEDLNQHIEQSTAPARSDAVQGPQIETALDAEPHRPEKMPARGVTWTDQGGMGPQQESAVDMIRAHYEHRQASDEARNQSAAGRERTEKDIAREAQEASREVTENRNPPDISIDPTTPRAVDRGDF